MDDEHDEHDGRDDRVSLDPLDPIAALKALLQVDPDGEPSEQDAPAEPAENNSKPPDA